MPLIIITGHPCCGKTKRSLEIIEFLQKEKDKVVHHISENDVIKTTGMDKNELYSNSQKEKEMRGILKSETLRLLGSDSVVILDAGNYIKGFRYELYCASKSSKTTQVTVECCANSEQAWTWNLDRAEEERYSREAFDALIMRYETPDSRNRWDSPLITLQHDDVFPTDVLFNALFHRKPPPPNQSTQCAPLSSTNFLYELDKVTQEIVASLLSAQKMGACGDVKVPGYNDIITLPDTTLSAAQLARHRREFLKYTSLNPPITGHDSTANLAGMFIQFLNTTLANSR
ncbi:protein KTI12 homolog [Macrosteles quadrilineatus]|uniref:protein KTI12 homolog n=1 Tax=Macrosteles quadrilineatus TaxID=74068 RepID=UPI0023E148E8|nr:protein KTI12 homolog [Macrosteles quadrilineatus]